MKPGSTFKVITLAALAWIGGCVEADDPITDGAFRDIAQDAEDAQFTAFETEQVRPLAFSDDGKRLFAVNTPDNRLEIFNVKASGLQHVTSISVGLEPTAVAVRGDQAWVVNHLSDSISIVDIGNGSQKYNVVRTLLVADEPRDIVFAGPQRRRAFITTAHRGQNAPYDPELITPGIGRADVWVFDALSLGSGAPLSIVSLFSDTPRGLAVSADGQTVYAAGFHTGNQTAAVSTAFTSVMGLPEPGTNHAGVPQPFELGLNGLIVKFTDGHWLDELGRIWDHAINFSLPDYDVFQIDAMANPPSVVQEFPGVGTILFNLAVSPTTGKVYVSNQEAFNEVRFEGAGDFTGQRGVQGHLHESRITVVDPSTGAVMPRHLNKHVNYDECCGPVGSDESERSLAIPTGMAITANGSKAYVTAFGSSKVGIFQLSQIDADTFIPNDTDHIEVSGGGPSGIVLEEARHRAFVMTRFDNSISIVDTASKLEVGKVALYNPEPASVVVGRPILYDARFSSSHGDSSCASCHVAGNFDSLAWDLGNPDGDTSPAPGPFTNTPFIDPSFNALKGPMTTQSLRGMANHGPMHWRGDRTGGNAEPSAQPDDGSFDEDAAFRDFNQAFVSLLGRDTQIPDEDMQAFADFALQLTYPPNPIRNLDNSLTPDQQAGSDFWFGPASVINFDLDCNGCHRLDPNDNVGSFRPGLFGSDAMQAFTFQNQVFKNAHLRNAYQKLGMFGMPANPFFNPIDNDFMGDQVRGFGYSHDGSVDTTFRFINVFTFTFDPVTNPTGLTADAAGMAVRRQLEQFMLAFDSNLKPIVGQQVTLHGNAGAVASRIALLRARAEAGDCDLTAKLRIGAVEIGWLYDDGDFTASLDALGDVPHGALALLAIVLNRPLTYTCVPPGNGERIALDRDMDGIYDADELVDGTDPADPASHD
jgi:DNA-binding beta-propeller fold protein YncE